MLLGIQPRHKINWHAMADAPQTAAMVESAALPDDNTKIVVEFLQKTYWEVGNLVFKGTAFYIGILAVLVGYVVTQRVPTRVAELTLYAAMATSVLAVTVAVMSGRAMYRCVGMSESLLVRQVTAVVGGPELRVVFSRWRKTIWTFGVCGTLLVVIFVSGMTVLLNSLDQIGNSRQQQSAQPGNATRPVQP